MAEIRALSCLDHRNIVRYHHCWTENLPAELLADSSSRYAPLSVPFSGPSSLHHSESDSEEKTDLNVSKLGNVKHLEAGPSIAEKNIHKRLARELRHDRQVSRMQETGNSIVFANSASAAPGIAESKALVKQKSFFRSPSSPDGSGSSNSSDDKDGVDNDNSADNGYSTEDIPRTAKVVSSSAVFDVVLFIQMSLHPMSLEDYLWSEQQKPGELKIEHCYHCLPTAQILLAILDGVDYIHRNKIVHRDLKPSNIMLSVSRHSNSLLDGSIRVTECPECPDYTGKELYITPHIGDFGLVAEIQDPEVSDPSLAVTTGGSSVPGITLFTPPLQSVSTFPGPKPALKLSPRERLSLAPVHSSGPGLSTRQPGTRFYVAPKSAKGKDFVCPKVDVYSLGVITLEMIYKFNTRSERAFELEKLKDGVLPQGLEKHSMASGIKSMLCSEREQRWSCAEVRKWLNNMILMEAALGKKDRA